ncbi:hypothetical protein GAYE_SCF20G4066 [Galdieria yellowstonensis]|uniref:Uncharacterized protein n=1 Tax=Galdieria yellowstonensis TaxID=3028027 RepID=A0AAV9IFD4_9RHOD|nr:hypothetical protein GAYE_SCF20G4066 [Galdieria yellowstonensis]
MGRKVARRRRRAYVESLIRSEKQQIEKQKEKKQMKEEREFLMDKIFTLQLDQDPLHQENMSQSQEKETSKKIKKLSKPIVKKQKTKDRRRRQKIRNRMQQAVAMLSS